MNNLEIGVYIIENDKYIGKIINKNMEGVSIIKLDNYTNYSDSRCISYLFFPLPNEYHPFSIVHK